MKSTRQTEHETTQVSSDTDARTTAVVRLLGALTLARVCLALMLAAGAVPIYALWESRAVWVPLMWQSPAVLPAVGVGIMLLAVGAAFQALQNQLTARTTHLYDQMRDQIEDLHQSINARGIETAAQIAALQLAERDCQQRLATALAKMGMQ